MPSGGAADLPALLGGRVRVAARLPSTVSPWSEFLNLLPLHGLAAERRDGLHPRLRELLEGRVRFAAAGVETLALHRGDPHIQAGPHPAGTTAEALPDKVVRLPARPNPDETGRSARP